MSATIQGFANQLIAEVGVSGIVGYATGYALKKILRLLLIVIGIFVGIQAAIVGYLESQGVLSINVNQDRFTQLLQSGVAWGVMQTSSFTGFALQGVSILGVGAAGFALVFQRG